MNRFLRRTTAAWLAVGVLQGSLSWAQSPGLSQQLKAVNAIVQPLAQQAAIYCVPIVAMYNLRYSISFAPSAKSKPGDIWRFAQIATPEVVRQTQYVSPNVNVLYGYSFVDLRREPVILSVPNSHGRYYMVQMVDMWTNSFAYAGGTATGYEGGRFALVGPGWQGTLPPGVVRIDAPTPWVELQPRVFVKNDADLPAAQSVLDQITLTGLAEANGQAVPPQPAYRYAVPDLDPAIASSKMPFRDPLQFWEICSAAMNENPPPQAQIDAVLPQFRMLGLELGKAWTAQSVRPVILQQMRTAASQIAGVLENAASISGARNGWVIPPYNLGRTGADYLTGAILAVVGLTGNTVDEAVYFHSAVDQVGRALTGAQNYTVTFRGDAPYLRTTGPGFWSLTVYDAASGYTVDNPINRYALGSSDDLRQNTDGSLTLYLQHDSPGADKAANWLPTPQGPFYVLLRNYAPVPAVYEQLKSPASMVAPPPLVPQDAAPGAWR